MNRKLILVCFSGWRVGSSMLTGLLGKMGANLGPYDQKADVLNPRGYFECKPLVGFVRKTFLDHLEMFSSPYNIHKLEQRCKKHKKGFIDMVDSTFSDAEVIATKMLHYAVVPMFYRDPNVKVISLSRNIYDQTESLLKVHTLATGAEREGKRQRIFEWLSEVYDWAAAFKAQSGMDFLDVTFEDILDFPERECQRIADFTGLPYYDGVTDWVTPKFSRSRATHT